MSNQSHIEQPRLAWGVPAIAATIGRPEKAVYHMLAKRSLPGARKVGGRWCFDPTVFFAGFAEQPGGTAGDTELITAATDYTPGPGQ
jgi:hypothetical protein